MLADDEGSKGGLLGKQTSAKEPGMIIGSGGMRRKTMDMVSGAIGMGARRVERRRGSSGMAGIGLIRTRVQKKG